MRIDFYLDLPYKKGKGFEEQISIKSQIKEHKKNGSVPVELLNPRETSIYLYFRIDGITIKEKTGERITAKYWNFEKQKVKQSYTGCTELNLKLDHIKTELEKKYRLLTVDKDIVNYDDLTRIISETFNYSKPKDSGQEFIDAFNLFIEVKGIDKSCLTLKKYKTLFNLLEKFQQRKNIRVAFESIDMAFYEAFISYLIRDENQTNNTVGKYVSTLKTFLHWATDRGLNSKLTYAKFKVLGSTPDIIYLTEEELMFLYNYDIKNKTLASVRDVFCFGCFTGQRFSDITKIKRKDVLSDTWYLRTTKTKDKLEIPLNNFALEILNKYSTDEEILPTMSNQKTNVYLKKIGELLEIDNETTRTRYQGHLAIEEVRPKYAFISTHTARRTFVTLSLEKGMRPETVMEITGHKDYKTLKKYIKITSKVKAVEMNKIWHG
jgi:site-specific recombinase XerD